MRYLRNSEVFCLPRTKTTTVIIFNINDTIAVKLYNITKNNCQGKSRASNAYKVWSWSSWLEPFKWRVPNCAPMLATWTLCGSISKIFTLWYFFSAIWYICYFMVFGLLDSVKDGDDEPTENNWKIVVFLTISLTKTLLCVCVCFSVNPLRSQIVLSNNSWGQICANVTVQLTLCSSYNFDRYYWLFVVCFLSDSLLKLYACSLILKPSITCCQMVEFIFFSFSLSVISDKLTFVCVLYDLSSKNLVSFCLPNYLLLGRRARFVVCFVLTPMIVDTIISSCYSTATNSPNLSSGIHDFYLWMILYKILIKLLLKHSFIFVIIKTDCCVLIGGGCI